MEPTAGAARFDRKFLPVMAAALVFMLVALYVRVTTDSDPLWSEFATPLFLGLLGARSVFRPAPPETRNPARGIGIFLMIAAALILVLALYNSQGAA
jgi:hypothetical protein